MDNVEFYKWYHGNDTIRPKDGYDILMAVWYDGFHYSVGYYIAEDDKLYIDGYDDEPIDFSEIDSWMMIDEPKDI